MNIHFNEHVLRNDTHFKYLLLYRKSDGGIGWDSGNIRPELREEIADNINLVLDHKPQYVKDNWFRIEIAVPNRNNFGNLVPGYIQDTVFFTAERELT